MPDKRDIISDPFTRDHWPNFTAAPIPTVPERSTMKKLLSVVTTIICLTATTTSYGDTDCICAQWQCSTFPGFYEYYAQICQGGNTWIDTYLSVIDFGEFPGFHCTSSSCDSGCINNSTNTSNPEPVPAEEFRAQDESVKADSTDQLTARVQSNLVSTGLNAKFPRVKNYPGQAELLNQLFVRIGEMPGTAIYVRVFVVKLDLPDHVDQGEPDEPVYTTTAVETTPGDADITMPWNAVEVVGKDQGLTKSRCIRFKIKKEDLGPDFQEDRTVTAILTTRVDVK